MKITIATGPTFPVPAMRGGAVQRMWASLAREFSARGHDVTVFARAFPGQASDETIDGIRYTRRGGYDQSTSIVRDLIRCLLYALKTVRLMPPGDVVVTNDFWTPAVLPWSNRRAGQVVVNANRYPKKQFRLYGKVAAVAAASGVVAAEIKRQAPRLSSRVAMVPNGVDDVFLGPLNRDGRRRPGRPLRILYVGRIHEEKGLLLLADALRMLGRQAAASGGGSAASCPLIDWECVLTGPVAESEGGGGRAFLEKLQERMSGLPVKFQREVYDPQQLADLYDTADVFVYPSVAERGESFGIAPLEAMARGVVPVVSDLAVFREYLEPGENGVMFDHRGERASVNLGEVLSELLADEPKRNRLGETARRKALEFSSSAIADKYLKLFEKVVSAP